MTPTMYTDIMALLRDGRYADALAIYGPAAVGLVAGELGITLPTTVPVYPPNTAPVPIGPVKAPGTVFDPLAALREKIAKAQAAQDAKKKDSNFLPWLIALGIGARLFL